jgi:hypothetical protein
MPDHSNITHPLLRLGRLALGPDLRGLAPGTAESGLVATATVAPPDSSTSRSYAWDVAWADAVREASQQGADAYTAQSLERGAMSIVGGRTQVVVAAHGETVLTWPLASGTGPSSVRVGPLPHLLEVADDAARRPACVVVLADRGGTDIIVHEAGDHVPARRFEAGSRPGAQHGPQFIAARVADAADSVAAHIVLGAGDQHILDAISGHLGETIGPVTTIAGGRAADGLDDHLSAGIDTALGEITSAAIAAVGDLLSSRAEGPSPAAVRGIKAVAEQLAEQQVAVLFVAADVARDATAGSSYRIGSRPTEFLVDDDTGVEVPLEDGLVWAAVHQDAIVVQLPDRTGPLAGEPAAALLRRGDAG